MLFPKLGLLPQMSQLAATVHSFSSASYGRSVMGRIGGRSCREGQG